MNTHDQIKITIYRLLAQREYSSAKIEQKLIGQGFQPPDIAPVLKELYQEGVINDRRFAENYIRYRQSHGFGPLRIGQELQARGLCKEMIEDHLNITDNAWLTEINKVWQKYFKGKLPNDYFAKVKQMRFLQQRGFTQEQIKYIISYDEM